MNPFIRLISVGALMLTTFGCAGSVKNMRAVANVNTVAAPNEAVVVFMRPSGVGFAIQSVVYEVVDKQPPRLVGIVAAKKKVALRVAPGPHVFMVVGESADFMEARLDPGKTYHALVTPRMGVWKARFSLRPVHVLDRADLAGWQSDTAWTELNEDSTRWATENAADVEEKRTKYWPAWLAKPAPERPVLVAEDGQ